MLNNITIRGGLTLVISVFVAFLLTVIGVGYGALKLANSSLDDTQRSAAALSHLKASSEKLLRVQLALSTYQTLFSVGKQTDDLLPSAHKVLVDSNKDFKDYMGGPFADERERKLAQSVEQARNALVRDGWQNLQGEYAILGDRGPLSAVIVCLDYSLTQSLAVVVVSGGDGNAASDEADRLKRQLFGE